MILLFGPGRIINIGRDLGDGLRQFRKEIQGPQELADGKETNVPEENPEPIEFESPQSNG